MSRIGYDEYGCDGEWATICWRGAVASAFRGKRGQSFLREMLAAMDAMPVKELVANDIVREGSVCAIGTVAVARKMSTDHIDPEDREMVAANFGIAPAMVAEIVYENDENGPRQYRGIYGDERPPGETDAERWTRMRKWTAESIADEVTP